MKTLQALLVLGLAACQPVGTESETKAERNDNAYIGDDFFATSALPFVPETIGGVTHRKLKNLKAVFQCTRQGSSELLSVSVLHDQGRRGVEKVKSVHLSYFKDATGDKPEMTSFASYKLKSGDPLKGQWKELNPRWGKGYGFDGTLKISAGPSRLRTATPQIPMKFAVARDPQFKNSKTYRAALKTFDKKGAEQKTTRMYCKKILL